MATKRLNTQITIGGAISGTLRGAFATAGKSLTQLGAEVRKLSTEQKTLSKGIDTFGRMGKNVDGLRAKYVTVTAQLEKMRAATERLARVERAREANLARRAELRGQMTDAVAVGLAAGAPIAAAVQFENAMLGVAKQLEGARDASGKLTPVYYDMAAAIQQLGHELPVPTNAIADMVAAGLRMGVASDQVLEFVRASAEMSTAFDMPEGELAESMGKIAGLYKIPIPSISALADSINYLDDNAIAKGGDIIDFMQRVGGVASSVRVTGNEMAALGSTLLTLGERTETAGTATNAMFQKLAAAEKGTKKFKAAVAEIGMSTAEIQKGMQTDAMGTLLKVLDEVGKLDADKQLGVLVELVGMEHSDTMAKLAGNTAEFRRQLELTNSEAAKGSMSREFAARMQTTNAQWELAKNRVVELGVNIGSILLPSINSLMGAVGPIVTKFAELTKEFPVLSKALVTVTTAMVAGRIAFLGGAYAVTFIKGAFIALRAVMLTNPIGAALAGVATAAYLIYDNWGPISAWFSKQWTAITGTMSRAWTSITGYFSNAWTTITSITSMAWDWVKTALGWTPLGLIKQNFEPLKGFFSAMWQDITATFQKALDWITSKIQWVGNTWQSTKSFFGFGDEEAPKSGSGTAPPKLAPPPLPSAATARGSMTYQDNSQNTIQVTQQAGESQEALAKRIAAELERNKQVRDRAALTDGAYAQ